ncbi:hypothetical protein K402DRAFT_38307 [Aulographum hederae CBS 113979]|uniref:F-box domain-containing protein n=1 Tax=Aulographum hederae CBS 113979 TaxID=1176131 RepID=A0A6G1H4N2_9PEZI|nr:hypothetical protein K402DRAFT_38307 [Aulographum hederae CBS 113979]
MLDHFFELQSLLTYFCRTLLEIRKVFYQQQTSITDMPQARSDSDMSRSPLLQLPPELVLTIGDHLGPASWVALRLSHPHFYHTLNTSTMRDLLLLKGQKLRELDNCARLSILTNIFEFGKDKSEITEQRCALCKEVYPSSLFDSEAPDPVTSRVLRERNASPAPRGRSLTPQASLRRTGQPWLKRIGSLELPPHICGWHRGRFVRTLSVAQIPNSSNRDLVGKTLMDFMFAQQASHKRAKRPGWTRKKEQLCLHCGIVQSWGTCTCRCETCVAVEVQTYTRLRGLDEAGEIGRGWDYEFVRDENGKLYVRETMTLGDRNETRDMLILEES